MITESYVSFETALMMKEAGFDEVCRMAIYETVGATVMYERNSNLPPGYVACPTQALAARWIREVHDIHIMVNVDFSSYIDGTPLNENREYILLWIEFADNKVHSNYARKIYKTYEAAFESGLQEALKLIIKNKEQ